MPDKDADPPARIRVLVADDHPVVRHGLTAHLGQPEEMAKLWSLVARMRLSGSTTVVKEAESLVREIGAQFMSENLTQEQIHKTAAKEDPLKALGEACRAELDTIDIDR